MIIFPRLIGLIFIIQVSLAHALTEKETIIAIMQKNYAIQISRLDLTTDSLTLAATKAAWLPQVNMELEQKIPILNYEKLPHLESNDYQSSNSEAQASIVQNLPGGGTFSGSLAEKHWRSLEDDSDSVNYTSSLELKYSQPLWRNAWKYGPNDYLIEVKQLNNQRVNTEQKKQLLTAITRVRQLYWSFYEQYVLNKIMSDKKEYAQKHLDSERARFSIGNATELDTLSARLDLLKAQGFSLNAQTRLDHARLELALELNLPTDKITITYPQDIQFTDLPETQEFIAKAEKFDHQLKIFDYLNQQLELQLNQQKNQHFPELKVEASYTSRLFGDHLLKKDNSLLQRNTVIALIARYSLPLKKRNLEKQKTLVSLKKNNLSLKHYKNELVLKVDQLIKSWKNELQTLTITQASQDIARKNFAATKAGYDIGKIDPLTLDKAENDFIEAQINLVQKQIELKKLEIIFDELSGTLLSKFGVTLE